MKNKKNFLRMGMFLAILMFLLIPLLSQPVAASFDSICWADTMDGPGGTPSVSITPPGYYKPENTAPRIAYFYCEYTMTDISGNTATPSSAHYVELNVYNRNTQKFQAVSSGLINLNNNEDYSGVLCITDTYAAKPTITVWDVWCYAYCEDLPTQTAAWNTGYWTITV